MIDAAGSATGKIQGKADSSIKNGIKAYGTVKSDMQGAIGTMNPTTLLKKGVDDAGKAFLNNLSIKPSSIALDVQQAGAEIIMLPKEISPNTIMQAKAAGKLQAGGITNQLYFSQQYNMFNNQNFVDYSFKSDIASKYRKMAETLSNGYSSILNKTLQGELTQLKSLKGKIDQSLTKNIDSVVHHATDLKQFIPASSLSEFNYENIVAGKNKAGIEKLRAELTKNHGGDSTVTSKLKRMEGMLNSIEQNQKTYLALNPDSTIAKYEEFMKSEKDKMLTKPSALKKFIKSNNLTGFNFNFLMWAKTMDLGSFFAPGSMASAIKGKAGAGFDLGNITKGIQVVLNNKNNVKLMLGDNVTSKVDALWQPNSMNAYLKDYQSTAPQLLQRLNGTLSIENIKALGGIDLGVSQQTAMPNLNTSFFGLTRKFSNFSLSKKVLNTKMHQLTVDVFTSITSYAKSTTSDATKSIQLPEISAEQKSLSYSLNYTGMFDKLDMETSVLLNSSSAAGPSSTGNYDRPSFDLDVFLKKHFLSNKLDVTANVNSSSFNSGLSGNNLSSRTGLVNLRYNISKKNIIDIVFRGNHNSSGALIDNSNYGFETGYNTSFKKKGLKYSILTKLTALHQFASFKSVKATDGWIKQISNTASISFPQNFSIQNTIDVSANTFTNYNFLTGNRITIAPGIEFQKKKYNFSTGLIYEQVTGYYQQLGTRNSVLVANLLQKQVSVNASLDLRYNLKQLTPFFAARWVSYGSISIQYLIK